MCKGGGDGAKGRSIGREVPEWQELLRSLDVEMKANQHTDLGGGFKYFLFSPPIWGRFPF